MVNIKELNIEYKSAIAFGVAALFLSLIIGLVAGNGVVNVFIRSFAFTAVFSAIGFASVFIIKKFVPEIYNILEGNVDNIASGKTISLEKENSSSDNISEDIEADATPVAAAPDLTEEDIDIGDDKKISDHEIELDTPSELDGVETGVPPGNLDTGSVVQDSTQTIGSNIKYEPKIAAQAIRTMMKRDEK